MTRPLVRAGLAALCILTLAGCIDSEGPILSDSQPVLGPELRLQLYTLNKGRVEDPEQTTFKWNGTRYAHVRGALDDVAGFTVHPFEGGTYIIQETPVKDPRTAEYALLRTIAAGVYLVQVIDKNDADAATRAAFCAEGDDAKSSTCRIKTREALMAFARATAARKKQDGGLVLRLPDTETPR